MLGSPCAADAMEPEKRKTGENMLSAHPLMGHGQSDVCTEGEPCCCEDLAFCRAQTLSVNSPAPFVCDVAAVLVDDVAPIYR